MTDNALPMARIGDAPMRGAKQIQRDVRNGGSGRDAAAGESRGRFPAFPPLGFGPIPSYR